MRGDDLAGPSVPGRDDYAPRMTDILEKAKDALPTGPKTHQLFIAGEWVDSVVRADLREPEPG